MGQKTDLRPLNRVLISHARAFFGGLSVECEESIDLSEMHYYHRGIGTAGDIAKYRGMAEKSTKAYRVKRTRLNAGLFTKWSSLSCRPLSLRAKIPTGGVILRQFD